MPQAAENARLHSILAALAARCGPLCRVLELGCGDRLELGAWIVQQNPTAQYIGLDRDIAALRRARHTFGMESALHLLCADCRHVPLHGVFDLLAIRHPNVDGNRIMWQGALVQSRLWLAAGGCLLVTTYHAPEAAQVHQWLTVTPLESCSLPAYELAPVALTGQDRYVLCYH